MEESNDGNEYGYNCKLTADSLQWYRRWVTNYRDNRLQRQIELAPAWPFCVSRDQLANEKQFQTMNLHGHGSLGCLWESIYVYTTSFHSISPQGSSWSRDSGWLPAFNKTEVWVPFISVEMYTAARGAICDHSQTNLFARWAVITIVTRCFRLEGGSGFLTS